MQAAATNMRVGRQVRAVVMERGSLTFKQDVAIDDEKN